MSTSPDQIGIAPAALTMSQIAAALSTSIPTAYRLANEGLLVTFTIGRKRYASPRAVQDCVQKLEERGAVLPMQSPASNRPRKRSSAA